MIKNLQQWKTDGPNSGPVPGQLRPWNKENGKALPVLLGTVLVFGLIVASSLFLIPKMPDGQPVRGEVKLLEEKGTGASIVTFERGWNLTHLVRRHYGRANPSILDMVLRANPSISDINRIPINQQIIMPPLSEASLVLSSHDEEHWVHLGTYDHRPSLQVFQDESALKGKTVETMVRNISPGEKWYRVVAGPFTSRDEALKTLSALKSKGLKLELEPSDK